MKFKVKLGFVLLDIPKYRSCKNTEVSVKESCIPRIETAQWGSYFADRPNEEAEPSNPFDIKN